MVGRAASHLLQHETRPAEGTGARAWILLSTRGLSDGEYRVVQLLLGGRDLDDKGP